MQVCKFGGASVKDAHGVRNLLKIVKTLDTPLVVVVSAMGKMTNAFEGLVQNYFQGHSKEATSQLNRIEAFHNQIVDDLFGIVKPRLLEAFFECQLHLEKRVTQPPSLHYDFEYDQIVSYGELLSTLIVSAYLKHSGVSNQWVDVRQVLKTDNLHRDANVDWEMTTRLIKETLTFDDCAIYVTQGFLGGTLSNITTTLGREGSDYSAAIIGYALDAQKVTIWKDVPGVLNADPRYHSNTVKLDSLSYLEAMELSYYGAKVIHPKTLKPLQNKQIPLYVKSFFDRSLAGTSIQQEGPRSMVPVFILKTNQLFMTLSARDFSFIAEDNLSEIFGFFSRFRIKINLMQSSALNFSVCVDHRDEVFELMKALRERFVLKYNTKVELLTIRHYTLRAINQRTKGREVIDSQISRNTARFVMRKEEQ